MDKQKVVIEFSWTEISVCAQEHAVWMPYTPESKAAALAQAVFLCGCKVGGHKE